MPDKNQTKVTKKTGVEIVLPGTTTTIYQPNRVTNARYRGFTLIQTKVFVSLIKQLQAAIKLDMEGKNWQQLDIFESPDRRLFKVGIPLSDIGKPFQYKEIAESCQAFTTLSIKLDPLPGYHSVATLAARVDTPIKEEGKSIIYIYLLKEVGEQLIKIDKSLRGSPEKFTNYIYEVAIRSKNKYTAKVYQIISSWKSKGGFKITYQTFREQIGVEDSEYTDYSDFKRRVLTPVQKELEKKADCWFNCSATDFAEREGQKVVRLNFKVIVPVLADERNIQLENLKYLLRNHIQGFQDKHIEKLAPILKEGLDYQSVQLKLLELRQYIIKNDGRDGKGHTINDIPSWVCSCLLNEFS